MGGGLPELISDPEPIMCHGNCNPEKLQHPMKCSGCCLEFEKGDVFAHLYTMDKFYCERLQCRYCFFGKWNKGLEKKFTCGGCGKASTRLRQGCITHSDHLVQIRCQNCQEYICNECPSFGPELCRGRHCQRCFEELNGPWIVEVDCACGGKFEQRYVRQCGHVPDTECTNCGRGVCMLCPHYFKNETVPCNGINCRAILCETCHDQDKKK